MDSQREKLIQALEQSDAGYDKSRILAAYDIAAAAHGDQKRASGEAYIIHPVEVAIILMQMGLDTDSIAAALLHDTVEDTKVVLEDIKKRFGPEVAGIVDGVTKLGRIPYTSKEEEQVENLRKMFLATAKDARVIIIKLADRLHNMRTLEYVEDSKRRSKSLETMEVYAPLAHRLGMQRIKIELEDLSLRYLDPVGYSEIEENMRVKEESRRNFLNETISRISERFKQTADFEIKIEGRIKHIYSIYRKMYRQNKGIDEIYDLYAVRIIAESITECYNALGIIHDMYKPIPGRFKDYISTPKPNMYQSLHTTVIGRDGIPFEVQIRTWDMHRTAEYGIAAHWKYKNNLSGGKTGADGDEKLAWVRKLLEAQSDSVDSEDFMQTFKIDFFSDEVFVFTPKGDLVNLPAGATAIDFAYSIHSAVGNRMIGAKVNGKMVPLEYQPQNGDIVEIVTSTVARGPGRDWLSIAKTTEARSKIKAWFKRERREENIQKGQSDLERELKAAGIIVSHKQKDETLSQIARRVGFSGSEDLYAAIGYGGISLNKVVSRFKEEYLRDTKPSDEEVLAAIQEKETQKAQSKVRSAVIVEGIDNCLTKYARCCNPLPGEPIIGYITKGYGVSVHRSDCKNVIASLQRGDENDRWIRVRWNEASEKAGSYQAALMITCAKKYGMLADISSALAGMKVFIHTLNARETEDVAILTLTIDVHDTAHFESIIKRIEEIDGVMKVRRGGR